MAGMKTHGTLFNILLNQDTYKDYSKALLADPTGVVIKYSLICIKLVSTEVFLGLNLGLT